MLFIRKYAILKLGTEGCPIGQPSVLPKGGSNKMIKHFAIIALAITVGSPALANMAVPTTGFPTPFPGAKFGDALLRMGPGVDVSDSGVDVDCHHPTPAVNIIVDGKGVLVPVSCIF